MAVDFAVMFNVCGVGSVPVFQNVPSFSHEMPFQKAKRAADVPPL
jgi:hypothetical protein